MLRGWSIISQYVQATKTRCVCVCLPYIRICCCSSFFLLPTNCFPVVVVAAAAAAVAVVIIFGFIWLGTVRTSFSNALSFFLGPFLFHADPPLRSAREFLFLYAWRFIDLNYMIDIKLSNFDGCIDRISACDKFIYLFIFISINTHHCTFHCTNYSIASQPAS